MAIWRQIGVRQLFGRLLCALNVIVFLCCFTPVAFAAPAKGEMRHSPQVNTGPSIPFNGIRGSDYLTFENEWKLVTVRYRTDNEEQRFVYANPLAYDALLKGAKEYPDGAAFGKIAVVTQDDPAFISSKVPAGNARMQIMVHDSKKYASTHGWGYGLFKSDGSWLVTDTSPEEQAKACDACHEMVQQSRGGVFSLPAHLRDLLKGVLPDTSVLANIMSFQDYEAKKLPASVQAHLPKEAKKVRFLAGSLREKPFVGTLNEIVPTLVAEAGRSGLPVLLLGRDEKLFSLVSSVDPHGKPVTCSGGKKGLQLYYVETHYDPAIGAVYELTTKPLCALPKSNKD